MGEKHSRPQVSRNGPGETCGAVGRFHFVDRKQQRAVGAVESGQVSNGHCSDGVPMIGVFESCKPETAFLPFVVPVLNGNSQRGLHRAGPIACEQHSSAPVGEEPRKSVSQFGGAGVREVAKNAVLEFSA